jgi:hypothetical protein
LRSGNSSSSSSSVLRVETVGCDEDGVANDGSATSSTSSGSSRFDSPSRSVNVGIVARSASTHALFLFAARTWQGELSIVGGGLGRCAVTSNCESECDATQQSKTTAPFNYLECAIVELQKRINNNCVIFFGRGNGSLCIHRFLVWVFVHM